ncbi:MAG: DUF1684 domain-containing protein [Cryomorphaceae bacterium]|nr:DUF1684 domain-containing protein [Flavobacteriales bacterium]
MKFTTSIFLCLFAALNSFGQESDDQIRYAEYWSGVEADFRNPEKSPLMEEDLADFDSIPRYAFNPDYRVEAVWEDVKRSKPFQIKATGKIRQRYQKVGLLHFAIGEDSLQLPVYRNLSLMRNPEYKDHLFLPFTDETNGESTYGGGRYLDVSHPEGDTLVVDFNRAYNPYCAYNDKYSCPIPPKENRLKVRVEAGAKHEGY